MDSGRILLVCDNNIIANDVTGILEPRGFEIIRSENGRDAINYLDDSFDLLIVRYGFESLDINDFVRKALLKDSLLAVFLLVEDRQISPMAQFPEYGISEIIKFPINKEQFIFLARVSVHMHQSAVSYKRIILSLEERNSSLQKQNMFLARRIEESSESLSHLYENLRSTYFKTVKSLVEAIDARDHYTRSHSEKVSRYAGLIAQEMGLAMNEIEVIRQASELHDVGKIGLEDKILTKPGPLNDEEWEQIKLHSVKGSQILEPLTFLEGVAMIVRQTHERYDGLGYPDGLKGNEISLGARIVSLADAYDVMTSLRSYRKEVMGKQGVIEEVKRNSGRQFDPKIVEVFLRILDKF